MHVVPVFRYRSNECCDSRRFGEASKTSFMENWAKHPRASCQNTSMVIWVAGLKKVLIELCRHLVPEFESLI